MIVFADPRIVRLIALIRAALRPPAGVGRIAPHDLCGGRAGNDRGYVLWP